MDKISKIRTSIIHNEKGSKRDSETSKGRLSTGKF